MSEVWTYFARSGLDGQIKIGKAKSPIERIKHLQIGNPEQIFLLGQVAGDRESELHERFSDFRRRGEWFEADEDLIQWIEENSEICALVASLVASAREVVFGCDNSIILQDSGFKDAVDTLRSLLDVFTNMEREHSKKQRRNFGKLGFPETYPPSDE